MKSKSIGLKISKVFFTILILLAGIFPIILISSGNSDFAYSLLDISNSNYKPSGISLSATQCLFLIFILYIPVTFFSGFLLQGIKMINLINENNILSEKLSLCLRNSGLYTIVIGAFMPILRFMINTTILYPEGYQQISLSVVDFFLVLLGWVMFVASKAVEKGVEAYIENKRFI